MKVNPTIVIRKTGGFNPRHQKPEAVIGTGDNPVLAGGVDEDGEFPSTTLVVHKRANVLDIGA